MTRNEKISCIRGLYLARGYEEIKSPCGTYYFVKGSNLIKVR
ncbi:hypothetical protein SAMN05446037_1006114 [Anaerovirgula multivorans]|uniref:Uncharacterized protein n=1 Tax=Anaerovirgula multivorans TaxID=312168 RepID=A0A239CR28_9FIRM|nr:hypothetical protein [Anaerovirgula multivorans]SNS22716.1 hypothetical protein SAMN05446037_1006114 [Anaerovirgula multivorans]